MRNNNFRSCNTCVTLYYINSTMVNKHNKKRAPVRDGRNSNCLLSFIFVSFSGYYHFSYSFTLLSTAFYAFNI